METWGQAEVLGVKLHMSSARRKKKKLSPEESERRWVKSRVPPLSIEQVFARIENSDVAIKKLFLNEPLTDNELDALMKSDYLMVSDNSEHQASTLYEPSKLSLAVTSPILFSNLELEILAYFGRHPELLYSLSPRKFEELVASVFRNNGFDVELTPETRDGGVDIIAVQKNGFAGSALHLVECKRYLPENKVGIGVVQRLLGVVEQHRATQGVIVTTSSFSNDAKICAKVSQYRIGLNEYSDLSKWLAAFSKS